MRPFSATSTLRERERRLGPTAKLLEAAEVLEAPRVMGVEAENSTEGTKRPRDLRIADDKRGNAFVTTMETLDVTIKILAHDGTQTEWEGMKTSNDHAPQLFLLEEE